MLTRASAVSKVFDRHLVLRQISEDETQFLRADILPTQTENKTTEYQLITDNVTGYRAGSD